MGLPPLLLGADVGLPLGAAVGELPLGAPVGLPPDVGASPEELGAAVGVSAQAVGSSVSCATARSSRIVTAAFFMRAPCCDPGGPVAVGYYSPAFTRH